MTPTETTEARLASILRRPMTASQAAHLDRRVSDARERERPASRSGRTLASGRGTSRRRLVLAIGLGLLLLATLLVSLPTLSKPTYQAQLRAAGVPEGVEVIAWRADKDGNLFDVKYRDATGKEHVLNPLTTPRATPTPRP